MSHHHKKITKPFYRNHRFFMRVIVSLAIFLQIILPPLTWAYPGNRPLFQVIDPNLIYPNNPSPISKAPSYEHWDGIECGVDGAVNQRHGVTGGAGSLLAWKYSLNEIERLNRGNLSALF
jgi:hypothetical protein